MDTVDWFDRFITLFAVEDFAAIHPRSVHLGDLGDQSSLLQSSLHFSQDWTDEDNGREAALERTWY